MDSSDHQLAVLQLAREKGINTNNLSRAEYVRLSIEVRSASQVLRDGTSAIISRGATSLRLRVVSDEVAEENQRICRTNTCGSFRELHGKKKLHPACDSCNCQSKFLESKWRDSRQKCPKDLWDNRGKGTGWLDKTAPEVEHGT